MNFLEAMKALTEGKKIRGKSWENGSFFLVLDQRDVIVGSDGDNANLLSNSVNEEWEIYEEPKTLKHEYEELHKTKGTFRTIADHCNDLQLLIEKEIARQEAKK